MNQEIQYERQRVLKKIRDKFYDGKFNPIVIDRYIRDIEIELLKEDKNAKKD